jgi:hypothetical protein
MTGKRNFLFRYWLAQRSRNPLAAGFGVTFIFLAGITASLLAFEFLPLPFVWIFVWWFAFFVAVSMASNTDSLKIVSINLAAVLGLFTLAEIVYVTKAEPDVAQERASAAASPSINKVHGQPFFPDGDASYQGYDVATILADDNLGYAPLANTQVNGRRSVGEELLYDVVYTIDSNGLRMTPAYRGDGIPGCILFFGGSFTFGEGVNDAEAMPYIVGAEINNRYRIFNFGYRGYGPHQMLSALEHGTVDDVVGECKVRYVFYQAVRAHIKRSAGVRPMLADKHGPRYRLSDNGELFYDGRFDEVSTTPEEMIMRRSTAYELLSRSYVFKEIHRRTVIESENIALLVSIVGASRRIVESRWPGAEFHVILWNDRFDPKGKWLEWALEDGQFTIHRIGDIITDYLGDKGRYQIHKEYDSHPNAVAQKQLADYIVREVITE